MMLIVLRRSKRTRVEAEKRLMRADDEGGFPLWAWTPMWELEAQTRVIRVRRQRGMDENPGRHRLVVCYLGVLASILIRGCVQEQVLRRSLELELSSVHPLFSGVIGEATVFQKDITEQPTNCESSSFHSWCATQFRFKGEDRQAPRIPCALASRLPEPASHFLCSFLVFLCRSFLCLFLAVFTALKSSPVQESGGIIALYDITNRQQKKIWLPH